MLKRQVKLEKPYHFEFVLEAIRDRMSELIQNFMTPKYIVVNKDLYDFLSLETQKYSLLYPGTSFKSLLLDKICILPNVVVEILIIESTLEYGFEVIPNAIEFRERGI